MRIQSAIHIARYLKEHGVEICEPPKYHICEGCDVRTSKKVGTGTKVDCQVHFNPFDERCAKHEKFMRLEKQRNEYNRNR